MLKTASRKNTKPYISDHDLGYLINYLTKGIEQDILYDIRRDGYSEVGKRCDLTPAVVELINEIWIAAGFKSRLIAKPDDESVPWEEKDIFLFRPGDPSEKP